MSLAFGAGCGQTTTLYTGPVFMTLDPDRPSVRAIEVDVQGRIVALHDAVTPGAHVVELPGAVAVPGLHDAHIHVAGIGRSAQRVDLRGARSVEEVIERLKRRGQVGPVVLGRGWDQSRFEGGQFPTALDLAPLGNTRPVVLTRIDGHAIWVNKRALELAKIDRNTRAPPGGRIVLTGNGEPSGVLVDNAMRLVTRKLPKPSLDTQLQWLWAGLEQCARDGLTAVHDMGMSVALLTALISELNNGRKLPIRLFIYLEGSQDSALRFLQLHGPGPVKLARRVWLMGAKLYADGAMGSRGAALIHAYSDAPGNRGLLLYDPKELARRVRAVHQAGFQVAVHGIGDRGARVTIDAIEQAQRDRRRTGPPHRLEHAQLIHRDDFERLRRVGIIASMQPTHATSDMRWAQARVGPQRIAHAYAWRTMLTRGVKLAFGSDAPIESHRPTWGLFAAVTRQDHAGQPEGGWRAEQRLTLSEALRAFSRGASEAVGMNDLGRFEVGALFDATIFDRDIRAHPPAKWLGTAVRGFLAAP